jgi:hypothetical protein
MAWRKPALLRGNSALLNASSKLPTSIGFKTAGIMAKPCF